MGMPGRMGGHPRFYRQPGFNVATLDNEQLEQLAVDLEEWADNKKRYNMPVVLEEFATDNGMSAQQFQACCKRCEKLADAKSYAKHVQRGILINGGLLKDSGYNANFIQFLLTHNHDFTPKEPKNKDKAGDKIASQLEVLTERLAPK